MRVTRAYVTSLGTTGVLLASSLLMLVVVGAFLSFKGWPESDPAGGVQQLLIDDEAAVVAVSSGPRAERRPGRESVRTSAGRAARARRVAVEREVGEGVRIRSVLPGAGSGDGPGERGTPRSDAPDGGRQVAARAPSPGDVRQGASEALGGVTGTAGEALGGASPALGGKVGEVGNTVNDVVRTDQPEAP